MELNDYRQYIDVEKCTLKDGGVTHEQEQIKLFLTALKTLDSVSPVMFELGSFEAFYCMLFNGYFKNVDGKMSVCVDAVPERLSTGIENAKNSGFKNIFFEEGRIGTLNTGMYSYGTQFDDLELSTNTLTVTELCKKYNVKKIDILHSDIQGAEVSVLQEVAEHQIAVEWFFINIHNDSVTRDFYGVEVYNKCKSILSNIGVEYYFDNPYQGGYGDGLIVAKKI